MTSIGSGSAANFEIELWRCRACERSETARIALFDARSGKPSGGVPVPVHVGPGIAMTDRWVVFSVGNTIRGLDVRSRAIRLLARTRGKPIGLALAGNSVAWAEDTQRGGYVRALSLP
jgi:hypothetical protein